MNDAASFVVDAVNTLRNAGLTGMIISRRDEIVLRPKRARRLAKNLASVAEMLQCSIGLGAVGVSPSTA